MAEALKKRSVQKYYRCIVTGEIKESTYLKGFLLKDEATNKVTISKTAKEGYLPIETEYRPVSCENGYTELEVHLITGRSHQIRAHLASIGHAIVGDSKYGNREINKKFREALKVQSQMLHAYRIVFEDKREVVAPTGKDYDKVWDFITNL